MLSLPGALQHLRLVLLLLLGCLLMFCYVFVSLVVVVVAQFFTFGK